MNALLDAALECSRLGWRLVPLHSPLKTGCSCQRGVACPSPGKHPRTAHGAHDASRHPEQIANWWHAWPCANVGLATGRASDVIVLDLDPRNGARATFLVLECELGCLPPTVEAETGGGGTHLFFQSPGFERARGTMGAGVDVKFEGGLTVLPPSLHASGSAYRWRASCSPFERAPAILPSVWRERLAPAIGALPLVQFSQTRAVYTERERRARSYARALPPAISGQGGHRVTFLAAVKMVVGFELDTDTAFSILWHEWNVRCQPPWSTDELRRKIGEATKARIFTPGFLLRERRSR